MPSPEILAVLADEVAEAGEVVGSAVADLASTEQATFDDAIERYREQLARIDGVCDILSLTGLKEVIAFVEHNLDALVPGSINPEQQRLFGKWPQITLGYLRAPKEGVYAREIVLYFERLEWPQPLDVEAASALEAKLVELADKTEDADPGHVDRATSANEADVVIEPVDEVNPALWEAFLTEGPLQAQQYSQTIQSIVRGEGWAGAVDEARRLIHALKGAANTVGVRGVATLSHHVEDILEYLADKSIVPQGRLARLLVQVADTLETMFEALLGTEEAPAEALQVLQQVLDVANLIDRGMIEDLSRDEITTSVEPPLAQETVQTTVITKESLIEDAPDSLTELPAAMVPDEMAAEIATDPVTALDAFSAPVEKPGDVEEPQLFAEPTAPEQAAVATGAIDLGEADEPSAPVSMPVAPEQPAAPKKTDTAPPVAVREKPAEQKQATKPNMAIEAKVRVNASAIDELLRMSGEMAISRAHIQERLQQAMRNLAELRERDGALWARVNELETAVTTQGVTAGRRAATMGSTGNVVSGAFDPLEMDQYSELHTQVHGLAENIADLRLLTANVTDALADITTTVNQQTLLNNELHNVLMTSRMLPVSTLEARMQRTVRQAADKTGKIVDLYVRGGDVMLDDQMVNVLVDPLQHILRNAVDHGLETNTLREELGKPRNGSIRLDFSRDGNYLVIKCEDDGAGLDLMRIHQTAVTRGLVNENQLLSDEEVARLILQPGFSTSREVTELSGRGVGMDIVNTSIMKLKGQIDIRTESGSGTAFILRLPMSMGIAHCLLVGVSGQNFALPTDNLDRIVFNGAANVSRLGNEWLYRDTNDTCRVEQLAGLVGYQLEHEYGEAGDGRPVVLMRVAGGKVAVIVDSVFSGRDLVIKNLGKYLPDVNGVVGASILGDGAVVPILELGELISDVGTATTAAPVRSVKREAIQASAVANDILVVDDSLSVRTALSILLSGSGYEVRVAKDGLEAIDEIEKGVPKAMLVDMEMPRMNGLELTATLRARGETANVPIIMITSRTAEKHRAQAKAAGVSHYLTKPYTETELLALIKTFLNKAA